MGAESVNLRAGEKPADVYTGIAMRHVPFFSELGIFFKMDGIYQSMDFGMVSWERCKCNLDSLLFALSGLLVST